ncbi:hypothetical protein DOM22_13325 [Bdellovibrio sp. ZAP7]|uniref:fibronectin type III domain-containing protein n=1 Tax=Bdellovibrio sp. ZAP7 TaxID=2231053 RepID=UPI001158A663|nr:fibronectin type III domain-containing protein [Bdellovibrio sp. ZAP7]QDK46067.1 hypothetical protein DOM22_13325 [Bdellovibrio sp. ZAP7]
MKSQYNMFKVVAISFLVTVSVFISGCLKERESTGAAASTSAWFAGATSAKNLGGYPSAVKVSWARADRSTLGYNIYSLRANSATGVNEWTLVGAVDADQTTYTDSDSLSEGQVYTYKVQAIDATSGAEDGNSKQVSTVTFYGIAGVTITGKTTATVSLNGSTGAFDSIHIYAQPKNGNGTATLVASANGNVENIDITGLRSGVNYKFSARAYMSYLAAEDGNESFVLGQTYSDSFGSGKTSDTTYYYRGVLNFRGFGLAPNATSGPTGRQFNMTWLPFSNATGATKYKIVRSTTTSIDMTASTACTSTTTASCKVCEVTGSPYCEDTALAAPPQTYYYAISVVKTDSSGATYAEELPCQNTTDCSNMALYTVKAHVPPDYMVLVQRDAANYEMCLNINASSDPRHNQRCVYSGLGAVPATTGPSKPSKSYDAGYYDFGYNVMVDRYRVACNWTKTSATCGPNGCVDVLNSVDNSTTPPSNALGVMGNVFYGHHKAWWTQDSCYVKSGSGWVGLSSTTSLTDAEIASAITNDPGPTGEKHRPAVSIFTQAAGSKMCNVQSTAYGTKRLLRRREYLVATPLPYIAGEPGYMSSLLAGAAPKNPLCDPDLYTPVTRATTISEWLAPGNSFVSMNVGGNSLNAWDNYANLKHFIGSPATNQCISRFGIQDPIGVGTVFSDTFVRTSGASTPITIQATTSTLDAGNSDHGSFHFNGTLGPYFYTTNSAGWYAYFGYATWGIPCGGTSATSYFIPAMGLPVCAWTLSSSQNMRKMSEYQLTGQMSTYPVNGTGDSIQYNVHMLATSYSTHSGLSSRYSTFWAGSTTRSYYSNLFCAVEAE